MGKLNNCLNHYLRNKRRFADLYNGVFFRGKQLINPEHLTDSSENYEESEGEKSETTERGERLERIRDIKMIWENKNKRYVLGLENQHSINYAMPFRCMQYDCMEYGRQLHSIRDQNDTENNYADWTEKSCGIKKSDRLMPVTTLCLYHGEDIWDGPRTLLDMMQLNNTDIPLCSLFADYPFRLYCINEETDFSAFHTELRQVFELLQYRKDKKGLLNLIKNHPTYQHMDADTLEVISTLLNIPKLWENRLKYMKKNNESEEYDMCQAIRELLADELNRGISAGIKESIKEGIKEGIEEKTIQIIKNMLNRHMNDDDIMAIAECSLEAIDKVRKAMH